MLNRGEVESRIDPIFYSLELFKFLEIQPFEVKTITQISEYVISGFAAGKGDQSFDEAVIQIRPTNIDNERELIFDRNVYLSRELLETCPADILKKGEVLFNNTNSQELVGKTTLLNIDGDFFCSNHITRIKTDESQMLPQFLTLVLNWYQERKIFYTICTNWNNQSGVNGTQLQKIKIPVPPIEIQKQIVEKFEKAYAEKKAKEAEAREKLASVDKLVLESV